LSGGAAFDAESSTSEPSLPERNVKAEGARKLDMADLDQTLGFLLSRAQQQVFREFNDRFADLEITPRLYSILILIKMNPGCRQTDIGAALGALQTNLVRRIDILVDRGLVTRASDPDDRRAKVLRLTPAGETMAAVAEQRHAQMVTDMERQGPKTDYPRLMQSVARFVAASQGADPREAEED
jgi:DNA-binding MarR family transcriptional regulator